MSYAKYEVRAYDDGTKHWYQDDQRHRTDGPAIELADGDKHWYQDFVRPRIDGPASELTEAQFNARTKPSCSGKVVEIDGKKYKLVELS